MQLPKWGLPGRRGAMATVALAAGLAAALTARQYIQGRVQEIEQLSHMPTVTRVVAAYDLSAGTQLQPDYVAVREIPDQWAGSTTLSPDDFVSRTNAVLAYDVKRGDPILSIALTEYKEPSLSQRLKAGRRAITLPVDDMSSQSGMLEPGDLIDLYVSFEYRGKHVTAPLLQGVSILAVGRQAEPSDGGGHSFSAVTLDASPEQAVKLVAAREAGTLTAILRHQSDHQTSRAASRGDLAGLLGMEEPKPHISQGIQVLYGDTPDVVNETQAGATSRSENRRGSRATEGLFQLPAFGSASFNGLSNGRP
jgi:pilus assembly protein CpaB